MGRELFGEDPVGALQQARTAGRGAREVKLAALRQARARLSGEGTDPSTALLSAAAGLLSPTRTGALSESLSQGLRGAVPYLNQERLLQERQSQRGDELAVAEGDVEVQGADRAYQELIGQMGLGATLTSRADALTDRREGRQERLEDRRLTREQLVQQREIDRALRREMFQGRMSTVQGKTIYKVIPKVGLAKITPDGEVEVIVDSPTADPTNDPALRVKAGNIIKAMPWFRDRDWAQVEGGAAKVLKDFVDQFLGGTLDPSVGPVRPQGGITPPGQELKKLVSGEFDLDDTTPQADPNKQNLPAMPDKAFEAGRRSEAQFTGKDLAKWETDTAKEANAAIATNTDIDYLRGLKADTGRLAPAKKFLGNWASAFGLDSFKESIDRADTLDGFNAVVSRMLQSVQTQQAGVQTEGDAKRFLQSLANAGNTAEANDLIFRYMKAMNFSVDQRQQFVADWKRNSEGGSMFGPGGKTNARSAWLEYRSKTPLVGERDGKPYFLNEYLEDQRKANPDEPNWRKLSMQRWNVRFGQGVR